MADKMPTWKYRAVPQADHNELIRRSGEDVVFYLKNNSYGVTLKCVDKEGHSNNIVTIKRNGYLYRHSAINCKYLCTDLKLDTKIRVSVNSDVS